MADDQKCTPIEKQIGHISLDSGFDQKTHFETFNLFQTYKDGMLQYTKSTNDNYVRIDL